MKNQKGYIDMGALFYGLVFIGVLIGLFIGIVVPWLWSLVKPFIHAATG